MGKQEWQDSSPLCCCEYWNIQQERSHILGCCCNCEDLDDGVERLQAIFFSAFEMDVSSSLSCDKIVASTCLQLHVTL
ncbi:hypothetical protein Cfor_08119 [Coptotermes formosanus]|uniref:Uncharacterized protein n=1 Tax=Coptotermes formosanus TaxID=36987 RepID=A0A6L2PDL1_COPFO|nr:hypothetical protein Cfor_08119 [Coptotermes formosanus]